MAKNVTWSPAEARGLNTDRIAELLTAIGNSNRLQREFVSTAIADLSPAEREELAQYLHYVQETERQSVSRMAEHYLALVRDTMKEQLHFRRNRTYRHSSFAEVARAVYQDHAYMESYMYGLALSSFLWPNHLRIKRWFVAQLPRDCAGSYLEIGPGHGWHFLTAMRLTNYGEFVGVDYSATSCAMTERLVKSGILGLKEPRLHTFVTGDFLELPLAGTYAAVVMGEVLEHVEQPRLFLERIRALTTPASFIYVTTVINAPMIDHIFLFRTFDEIATMVAAAGLRILDHVVVPPSGVALEAAVAQQLPLAVALTLGHN